MTTSRTLACLAVGLAALAVVASATKCIHFKYADRCNLKQIIKTYMDAGPMNNAQIVDMHRTFAKCEYVGQSAIEHAFLLSRPDLAPAGMVHTAVYTPAADYCTDQFGQIDFNDVMCFEMGERTRFEGRDCTKYYNTTDVAYYVTDDNEMIGFSVPGGYVTVAYETNVKYTADFFVETHKGCLKEFATPPSKDVFDAVCYNTTARINLLAGPMHALRIAKLL